jgi:hypothetical protein
MVVRLRFRPGRRVSRRQGKNRHLALALATLLWPAALSAYVLGFWRLAADLGLAGGFGIAEGVFSHWQAWLALAVLLNVAAILLNRYGHLGLIRIPDSWFAWLANFGRRS